MLAISIAKNGCSLIPLSDTCQQIMWMKSLFEELGFPFGTVPISGDNMGLIFIRSNPVQEWQTKHINIRYHYICKCIEDKAVSVSFIPRTENPADMFTKNLPVPTFMKFRDHLGIKFLEQTKSHTS